MWESTEWVEAMSQSEKTTYSHNELNGYEAQD